MKEDEYTATDGHTIIGDFLAYEREVATTIPALLP